MGMPYIIVSAVLFFFVIAGLILLFIEGGDIKKRLPKVLAGLAGFAVAAAALWFFVKWLIVPAPY